MINKNRKRLTGLRVPANRRSGENQARPMRHMWFMKKKTCLNHNSHDSGNYTE